MKKNNDRKAKPGLPAVVCRASFGRDSTNKQRRRVVMFGNPTIFNFVGSNTKILVSHLIALAVFYARIFKELMFSEQLRSLIGNMRNGELRINKRVNGE
jgi:hypothetical protein